MYFDIKSSVAIGARVANRGMGKQNSRIFANPDMLIFVVVLSEQKTHGSALLHSTLLQL